MFKGPTTGLALLKFYSSPFISSQAQIQEPTERDNLPEKGGLSTKPDILLNESR